MHRFSPAQSFLFAVASLAPNLSAQCPSDDANEPNDSCQTASAGNFSLTSGLSVTSESEDFWSYSVPPGQVLQVGILTSEAGLYALLFGSNCSSILDVGSTFDDDEFVSFVNTGTSAEVITLQVALLAGSCADYALDVSLMPDPCPTLMADAQEDNDSCAAAWTPSVNPLMNLSVSRADEDFFSAFVPAGHRLEVTALHLAHEGDLDVEFIDGGDCQTLLASGSGGVDDESVSWGNTSGLDKTVAIRIFMNPQDSWECHVDYDLDIDVAFDPCLVTPNDALEENDTCAAAVPISSGTTSGLRANKASVDDDWYTILVGPGGTLSASAFFSKSSGNIDMEIWSGCSTLEDSGISAGDDEFVSATNNSGQIQSYQIRVFLYENTTADCNDYDLDVSVIGGGPTNLLPFCFGDGSGTPCPCGNESTPGHMGGCRHSAANGGILRGLGNPSLTSDTLELKLYEATADSFGLLVSAINKLPQSGACVGCGVQAFDGLRCAGGDFKRHGTRATNFAGVTQNPWGLGGFPGGPLISGSAFVAGTTRHFFVIFRSDPFTNCQSGRNTTNGLSITIEP